MEDELKQLEAQVAAQDAMLNLLKSGALGNTEGYSEYMRAFARQSINGLWLTAFDITGDGAQMSLSGAVLSPQLVPAYIQRLGKEKVMRGKTFSTLQMQQPKRTASGPFRAMLNSICIRRQLQRRRKNDDASTDRQDRRQGGRVFRCANAH